MIDDARASTNWKAQRWLAAVLVIFLLQFLFIYFLSARSRGSTRSLPSPFLLQISSVPWTDATFTKEFLATDPALFALPGTHGFSGAAWLKDPVRNYDVGNLFEQKEPPFWLALDASRLGNSISQFVRANAISQSLRMEDSRPRIQAHFLDLPSDTQTNSQLRIEGELAEREALSSQSLPSWPHTNILGNSVAEIAVDQNGMVVSARLLSKSGLEKADRSAMETARNFQFARDKRPIAWGTLIFDWHTLPVETTNAAVQIKPP